MSFGPLSRSVRNIAQRLLDSGVVTSMAAAYDQAREIYQENLQFEMQFTDIPPPSSPLLPHKKPRIEHHKPYQDTENLPPKRIFVQPMTHAHTTNAVSSGEGNTSTRPAIKMVSRRTRKFKSVPNRKPSLVFKELVEKSLKPSVSIGHKRDISYYYMDAAGLNQQVVKLKDVTGNAFKVDTSLFGTHYYDYYMFHPQYFLDAAAVLWNNNNTTYPVSEGTYALGNPLYPGDGNALGTGDAGTLEDQKYKQTGKVRVIDCYEEWQIKNNTQRSWTLKLHLCAPKKPGFSSTSSWDISAGYLSNNTPENLPGPCGSWALSVAEDSNDGITQIPHGSGASQVPETLWTSPLETMSWKKKWKADITEVVLPPGTSYEWKIPGPKQLDVDMTKYVEVGRIQDVRTYCRAPLIIAIPDLCGNAGYLEPMRWPYHFSSGGGPNLGTQLGIERKRYVKLEMPDQYDILLKTSGGATFTGTSRFQKTERPAYMTYIWQPVIAPNATDVEIQIENPQAAASIPT